VTDPDSPGADLAGRRVLVTGGAGFVGGHLARALVPETEVVVYDHLSTGSRDAVPDDADLVVGDVRDGDDLAAAMTGVDVVFHQAAQVSVEDSVIAPLATDRTNVAGTVAVLEAARRHDARVVLASSAAIYGQPETVPIDEDHPTDPTNPYGVSKLAADHYARVYAEQYGLPTVPLRYFNVYGPGQTGSDYAGVVTTFLEQARAGDPITVEGDGEQTRDFVHVDDVVRANCLAATTDAVGEAVNVGTGTSVTIRELAERVREATGSDAPIQHVPGRSNDVEASRADLTAARERLGFQPRVDLATGLASLCEVAAPGR